MAGVDEKLVIPKEPVETPVRQRAIQLRPMLNRYVPYWGHPNWLSATRWRYFVRNQPLCIVCRDTLIANMLSAEWDIQPRDADDESGDTRKAIDYYRELFEFGLDKSFDAHLELVMQDYLDLPLGAVSEVGTLNDDPEGPVVWAEHVDAATCMPTNEPDWPIRQSMAEAPQAVVVFPRHAVRNIQSTPRPEIKRSGWGMAPPEKAYLAIELLFRGDRYYANLLLDTPEAGILDLMDMAKDSALDWLESMRTMFQGIDGFKVPVLYEHETPAKWLPLNRPPIDLTYDKVTLKYAQIMAAAYGLRLSDIGLDEGTAGAGTLAGVIRSERQSKRTGYGRCRSAAKNYFDSLLPRKLQFLWKDRDEETIVAKGKAMVSVGQGLKTLKDGGFIDQAEGRRQLIAEGLFDVDLDPNKLPDPPAPMMPFGATPFQKNGNEKPQPPKPGDDDKVAPSEGGRGETPVPLSTEPQSAVQRFIGRITNRQQPEPESNPALVSQDVLLQRMEDLIKPGLQAMVANAASEPIRIRRLVRAMTRHMVPEMVQITRSLTDEQIGNYWLPEMQALTFDQESELDSPVMRNILDDARKVLDEHLGADDWWKTASTVEKASILEVFAAAFERGIAEQALLMLRALYEEGLANRPNLIGISFDLVNRRMLQRLEDTAALLIQRIDEGTQFFIRRVVVAGVRQGLSSPRIAAALRDGARADAILRDEGYMQDAIEAILEGLTEMSEYRTNSIVNTEINRVENEAKLEQMTRQGLKTKAWRHLGERGVTEAGNQHPCPICLANEELGFVKIGHVYKTVFEEGAQTPPGHPGECHCAIRFDEKELFDIVGAGQFTPWTGD